MNESIHIETKPEDKYPDYLRDESRRPGRADSICFPESAAQVAEYVTRLHKDAVPITVQGARTGIVGGAVPEGGSILNLSRMNAIGAVNETGSGEASVSVQPGVLLQDLRQFIAEQSFSRPFFFTPDPTETTASIGGMIATDASGAMSYFYGSTRDSVISLELILADGDVLKLKRGEAFANEYAFELCTESGARIAGNLPCCGMPEIKNTAGYFVKPGMDLIDLFIGAEGTLGIITEAELRLSSLPSTVWGIMVFLPSLDSAVQFVENARGLEHVPAAVELFDENALQLLRDKKQSDAGLDDIPDIPLEWRVAVYVEFHGSSPEEVENAVMLMTEGIADAGGSEDATWLATDEREMQRLKDFRHAVPEAVNSVIDEYRKNEPQLTKLGTDLAVPAADFAEICRIYSRDLDNSGLAHVIFGHAAESHLHVNILPKTLEEYDKGKQLYEKWAREVVSMGGTISAEHGIGKLKTDMLRIMYSDAEIEAMANLKKTFDPRWQLNRGDIFKDREAE
jgi:D-lactate dehydrogenase (cytochrome)